MGTVMISFAMVDTIGRACLSHANLIRFVALQTVSADHTRISHYADTIASFTFTSTGIGNIAVTTEGSVATVKTTETSRTDNIGIVTTLL